VIVAAGSHDRCPSSLTLTHLGYLSRGWIRQDTQAGDHFPEDLVRIWFDWTVVLSGDVSITFIHLTTVCSYPYSIE
jgi:hypothetical protein